MVRAPLQIGIKDWGWNSCFETISTLNKPGNPAISFGELILHDWWAQTIISHAMPPYSDPLNSNKLFRPHCAKCNELNWYSSYCLRKAVGWKQMWIMLCWKKWVKCYWHFVWLSLWFFIFLILRKIWIACKKWDWEEEEELLCPATLFGGSSCKTNKKRNLRDSETAGV